MQDSWKRLMSDSTSWQKTLKNSHNLQIQWLVASTLCQEMKKHLTRKVGFEGTPKLGPYWKSQQGIYKVNMVEIKIESLNKDNSHSWVKIFHGLNKLVTELSNNKENDNNEQETSEMQFDNFALKSNARGLLQADQRSKQNHKDALLPIHNNFTHRVKKWIDVEPTNCPPVDYPVSQQLSTLLRHGHLPRENGGAIEFWRAKEYLRNDLERSQHWCDEKWKSSMTKDGRSFKDAISLILDYKTMY